MYNFIKKNEFLLVGLFGMLWLPAGLFPAIANEPKCPQPFIFWLRLLGWVVFAAWLVVSAALYWKARTDAKLNRLDEWSPKN